MADIDQLTVGHLADGEVIYDDPVLGIRKTAYKIDEKHTAIKTEYYMVDQLLDANAQDRANQAGTNWGEGKIIGRVPFHLLHDKENGLMKAFEQKDDDYIRRYLNENSKFKTRDKI